MSDCKERKQLPNPTNVRLSKELLQRIQEQASRNERTLSQQIRWLLSMSLSPSEGQATEDE